MSIIITRNLFFYNSLVQEKIGPEQNNVCGFLDIFIERFSIECHKTKIWNLSLQYNCYFFYSSWFFKAYLQYDIILIKTTI